MRVVYTHISVPNRRKEHRQEAKLGTSYAEMLTTTIGQTLLCGTRLTLFSDEKPDRLFTAAGITVYLETTELLKRLRRSQPTNHPALQSCMIEPMTPAYPGRD